MDGNKIIKNLIFETPDNRSYSIGESSLSKIAPPNLNIEFEFVDKNKNGVMEAGEEAKVILKVKNIGNGSAYVLKGSLVPKGNYQYLDFTVERIIYTINPDEVKELAFDILASKYTPEDECQFSIIFSEENGFEPTPLNFSFNTKSYKKPQLSIERAFYDHNNNEIIEPLEIIKVITRVLNKGGPAYNVRTFIDAGENVFLTIVSYIFRKL